MDKETAFRVLGLTSSASLAQAKNAYRQLAKKYHPDVVEQKTADASHSESRMKEINLAFRFLMPYLKSKSIVEKDINAYASDKKRHAKSTWTKETIPINIFFVLKEFFSKTVSSLRQKQRKKNRTHTQPKTKQSAPGKGRTDRKKQDKIKFGKVQFDQVNFGDVFNAVSPAGFKTNRIKVKSNSDRHKKTHSPYSRYQQYMKLKKRYQPVSARKSEHSSIDRVSKIDPVSPIDPVEKK